MVDLLHLPLFVEGGWHVGTKLPIRLFWRGEVTFRSAVAACLERA